MMIDKRSEAGGIQRGFQSLVEDIRGCLLEVFAEPGINGHVSREGVEEVGVPRLIPDVEPFVGCELLHIDLIPEYPV
jgi:hypothetical protein